MIPFIWLIGAGVSALIFSSTRGFGLWGKDKDGAPIKQNKLAILGPSGSGKSLFFSFLKDGKIIKSYSSTMFTGEEIETLEIQDGEKKLILTRTKDVPGSILSIGNHYPKLISECTDIFFIFNCKEFLENETYRELTMSIDITS